MKQPCTFHPTRTAHWTCPKCRAALCPPCTSIRELGGHLAGQTLNFCPKCNVELDWVGAENIIDPFWRRLPKIFLYPFSLRPMILMILLAIGEVIVAGPGLIRLVLQVVIWGLMLKYAYASLKLTASGDLRTPPIDQKTLTQDFGEVFKQTGLFIVLALGCVFVLFQLHWTAAIVYLIVVLMCMPAMIILLVSTQSLIAALNPMLFIPLAWRIGWGYLLMYLFLLFLLGAPLALTQWVVPILNDQMTALVYSLAANFYTLVSYHLMGYVILQYHDRIGYRVDAEDFFDPSAPSDTDMGMDSETRLLTEISPMIQDGNLNGAIAAIEAGIQATGITTVALSDRFYTLLKMQRQTDRQLEVATAHLALLAKSNEKAKATEVYNECRRINPEFTPNPPTLMKMAGWLNESGKSEAAIATYNRLIKVYPDDPEVPRAYFRAAQILHDRLMKTEKAKKILSAILTKFPNHDIAMHVRNYLAHM